MVFDAFFVLLITTMRPFCAQEKHREQSPPGNDGARQQQPGIGDEEEEENRNPSEDDVSLFRCVSCEQGRDVALLLPCSHTLCGRCVAAGVQTTRGAAPTCALLCSFCRHLVELPCWDWASATACLPRDPTQWRPRQARARSTPPPLQYLTVGTGMSVLY